jgi:hypothetical protein
MNASVKLLMILKKFMLYYTHQWRKTASDYRQLLTINDPLMEEDGVLCDLLVRYNEKLYGERQCDARKSISIDRDEFFQQKKNQRIEFIYQIAMSMSTNDDILIGLEQLCTQSPLWLADYLIDNWIPIQNEKFKQKSPLFRLCLKSEIDNPCLFPQLPKNVTQRILHHITDAVDFHSMQFVYQQWYALFHEESFWRDLYISRYGMFIEIFYFISIMTSALQRCPSRLKTDRCRAAMREAKYLPRRCRTAPKITSTAAAPHRDGYFRKSTATAPLPRWASEKSFNSHDCDCFGLELWSPLNHISRISLCCI